MKFINILLLLFLFLTSLFTQEIVQSQIITHTNELQLDCYFKGYQGAFVILDLNTENVQRYNPYQCKERFSPCSTFKIANAICALENNIVNSPDQVLKWDGKTYSNEVWNKDLTLHQAMTVSAVPHFQEIARKIGNRRMQKFLDKINYGNKDISGGISEFWLGSTLKISANEQVQFIKKVVIYDLPVSKISIEIVKRSSNLKKQKKEFCTEKPALMEVQSLVGLSVL